MKLVAMQMNIDWEDRRANHARVRRLLDGANVPAGAMIVLPELFDVGFSLNTAKTDPGEPSESEVFCRALAAERNCTVLAGVVARTKDGKFANEAVAISADGTERVRYRKMRPFTLPGEHLHYVAGENWAGFVEQGVHVAPFICYDLRFPELFRPAAKAGAELIVVIANWNAKRSEHWIRLLQARAIENQAFVLGVNRVGQDQTVTYNGGSALFDPLGVELFRADDQERVIVAEIDPHVAREWRSKFPALRDAQI